ncbi:MAG: type I methionyl aminopeptidase [Patescibacteria group bacterium]|nr:type I methionyl aminopeptidase [Patescibacteria group bacterium]
MIRLKKENDLRVLRTSGRILASVLQKLEEETKEGIELIYLDKLARRLIKKAGAKPAFLGYKPEGGTKLYPAAICTSVNEQIVHCLPSEYVLRKGDVLKIDFGVDYQGYITDSAVTVGIGELTGKAKELVDITKETLEKAIEECRPGKHTGDIGWMIEKTVKGAGFHVIKNLTGHGVGFELHEDPTVYNYGNRGEGVKLVPGLVLAIEPMVSVSSSRVMQKSDDSYVTEDGSLSAHFEHTIAITESGPEVLTSRESAFVSG